jgi:signal recognition particle GTPase
MAEGLYANIHAKRKRIAAGSGEKMRKVGSKGAPTAEAFKASAKTAKKPKKKSMMNRS